MLYLLETIGDQVEMVFRFQVFQEFHRAWNQPHNTGRPIHIILAKMVCKFHIMDAIMFQRLQKPDAVQLFFGDFVSAVELP